jgi:hypothetical protein
MIIAALIGAMGTAGIFSYFGIGSTPITLPVDQGVKVWTQTTADDVHFHANFAVFLQGKLVDMSDKSYMEELQTCLKPTKEQSPRDRAHQHEGVGGLIHVHAPGVTWGHFFANIGWNFGEGYIVDRASVFYKTQKEFKVRYILNGALVFDPFNQPIFSKDRLLIDYSRDIDAVVLERYKRVPTSADEANSKQDPATCHGHS